MPKRWDPKHFNGEPSGLILFDGVCVLCSRWVAFIIARDQPGRFRFMPIQSDGGRIMAGRLGIDLEAPETNAAVIDGIAYFKGDAALMVLGQLQGYGWTRAAWLCPKPIRDWCYDRIARNRYRIFGRTDSCLVPEPALRSRFLDRLPPA